MKIAIISDIHDNIWKLARALEAVQQADALICCGDLCSPFVMDQLGKGFAGPIHIVFGNNDGDRFRLTVKAGAYRHVTLHGEFAELSLGGRSFAVHHFDDVANALARGGQYDVVCFGHNHRFEIRREGPTLVINPGEIMGGLSTPQVATFVIYDTVDDVAQRLEVE